MHFFKLLKVLKEDLTPEMKAAKDKRMDKLKRALSQSYNNKNGMLAISIYIYNVYIYIYNVSIKTSI